MFDEPIQDPNNISQKTFFQSCDIILTALFSMEFTFKVIANGCMFNYQNKDQAYL